MAFRQLTKLPVAIPRQLRLVLGHPRKERIGFGDFVDHGGHRDLLSFAQQPLEVAFVICPLAQPLLHPLDECCMGKRFEAGAFRRLPKLQDGETSHDIRIELGRAELL